MKVNEIIRCLGRFRDEDSTEKFVFKVLNKGIIEVAWIKNKERVDVLCLPTHYYCTLGCKFCHLSSPIKTPKMEKISFYDLFPIIRWLIDRYLIADRILLSFMGVGEPTYQYTLLKGIYDLLLNNNKEVSFAISTMVPDNGVLKETLVNLLKWNISTKVHFSLHSPKDNVRRKLIPSQNNYSIHDTLRQLFAYEILVKDSCRNNMQFYHKNCRMIELHYILIDGINDSDEELSLLLELGRVFQIPLKILSFNPIGNLKKSSREDFWLKKLQEEYEPGVTYYIPPGQNIGSSCGQFTKHYYLGCTNEKELEEFEEWRKKYQIDF